MSAPLTDELLARALQAIDAANAQDPRRIEAPGAAGPDAAGPEAKELWAARRVTHWLERLVAAPGPELRLAARAHHLRRWVIPRERYPDGRAGYHQWRQVQKEHHASEVTRLLEDQGVAAPVIARVVALVKKRGLEQRGQDPEVQALEDAICLTFLEHDYEELAARLSDDKMVEVLARTLPKMSAAGHALAAEVPLGPRLRELLARAVKTLAAAPEAGG